MGGGGRKPSELAEVEEVKQGGFTTLFTCEKKMKPFVLHPMLHIEFQGTRERGEGKKATATVRQASTTFIRRD